MTTVLFVCTGNICRSPTAAALLSQRLVSVGNSVSISSAGILDLDQPSPAEMVAAGSQLGIDLTQHRGRRVSTTDILDATLIIGMAREHIREVALLQPTCWPIAFTLRELIWRGRAVGPRGRHHSLNDWLHHVHQGRRTVDLMGKSVDDDIEDPMGGSPDDYLASAEQIAGFVDELVTLVWPTAAQPNRQ